MSPAFLASFRYSAIAILAYGTSFSSARAVDLPSGTAQVVLQDAYPGEASFTLPAGGSIVSADTLVIGDNAQNWSITNFGLLSATSVATASGLHLGAADQNQTVVVNYGTITSAGTSGSAASGVRFSHGGQVTNQAGATISGYDGLHTDNGSILVNNFGTITGIRATGIYSGLAARIVNYASGTITGSSFGASCNGSGQCIIENSGTIHGNDNGVNYIGSNLYSLLNTQSGAITGGNHAVLFSGSNGQILNQGLLQATSSNGIGVATESSGNVYVNAGTIQGGSNGTAFQLIGDGNTVYNLGAMIGSRTALSITGDANTLVLGTHVFLPGRGIDVTGPGSSITGSITASGSGNAVLLTDSGSESTPFMGFDTLALAGENWVLTNSFALNGTAADSVAVRSGTLVLNGAVATQGGTTVSGGALMVGDADHRSATLTTPGGVTVLADATLGGAGTLIGDVANSGALTTAAQLSGRRSAFTIEGNVTNSGSIVLAAGAPGNVLTIAGSLASAGGRLVINTTLGGDSAPTDMLVLAGGRASGTTSVLVQNAGTGIGLQTSVGILIVKTIEGATTAADSFALDPASRGYRATTGTIASGAFDYSLVRGGSGGVADSWYLTSLSSPSPSPAPPDNGGVQPARRIYRPEGGVYLTNQAVARTMFTMTLHDRDSYGPGDPGTARSGISGWARVSGNRLSGEVAAGTLKLRADSTVVQVGADLWRHDSASYGTLRFGVMGGYGSADTATHSRLLANYTADGNVTGYNLGIYGTWWQHGPAASGAHVDLWAQHGWFDNAVRGRGLPKESYDARALTASIEIGYAFELMRSASWRVLLEPQAQTVHVDYSADALTEQNGTSVRFRNGSGTTFRLGGRLSAVYAGANGVAIRPYLEANWWRSGDWGALQLNGDMVRLDLPKSFGEVKIGTEAEFGKNWSVWGQVATLAGRNHFRQYGGQAGLKYIW